MKKTLLSLSLLTSILCVNAQDTPIGYEFDFSGTNEEEPNYVKKSYTEGCGGGGNIQDQVFSADRSTDGELKLSYNGEHLSYENIQLRFPKGAIGTTPVDLSDEENQKIELVLSGNVDGQILIFFGDETTKHPTKGWEIPADNVPAIQLNEYKASMGEITLNNNNDSFDGNDFGNGGFSWKVFPNPNDSALAATADDPILLDSTAITQIWIYYRGIEYDADSVPVAVEPDCNNLSGDEQIEGTLTIKSIKIGDAVLIGLNEKVKEATFDAYPTPSSDKVSFSKELENLEVYNAQGLLMAKEAKTSSIDVSAYEPGLYIIQTAEGFKRIVVE